MPRVEPSRSNALAGAEVRRQQEPSEPRREAAGRSASVPGFQFPVLYLGLLWLATAGSLFLPSGSVPPGLVFVMLAVGAHGAARVIGVSGAGKAMLFLEGVPFFAFAVVHLGQREALPALLIVVSGASAGAALLAGEWLLVKGSATFMTSLAFIGGCSLAGAGLALLPTRVFLGLALLGLTLASYGVARRVHG